MRRASKRPFEGDRDADLRPMAEVEVLRHSDGLTWSPMSTTIGRDVSRFDHVMTKAVSSGWSDQLHCPQNLVFVFRDGRAH